MKEGCEKKEKELFINLHTEMKSVEEAMLKISILQAAKKTFGTIKKGKYRNENYKMV